MEKIKVYCNSCKLKSNHEILSQQKRRIDDDDSGIAFFDTWQIIRCSGCETVSFCHSYYDTDYLDETVKLYPVRSENTHQLKPYYNVPKIVRSIYRETIDAYNNDLNLLCAAGLRAVIESICNEEKIINGPSDRKNKAGKIIRSRDLAGKINGLEGKGIITKKQAIIIHEQRYLGNEAIHRFDAPSKKVLITAIEIIENILDSLYEINEKAGMLQFRREQIEKRKKK